jgi:hypothetical protein
MRSLGAGRLSLPEAEAEIMYGAVTVVATFLKNMRLEIMCCFCFIFILPKTVRVDIPV